MPRMHPEERLTEDARVEFLPMHLYPKLIRSFSHRLGIEGFENSEQKIKLLCREREV